MNFKQFLNESKNGQTVFANNKGRIGKTFIDEHGEEFPNRTVLEINDKFMVYVTTSLSGVISLTKLDKSSNITDMVQITRDGSKALKSVL